MMLRRIVTPNNAKLIQSRLGVAAKLPIQQIRHHGDGPGPDAPTINLTFVNPDDTQTTVAARIGETLLQTAHRTGIEIEGACEGVCACSTCHVILSQDLYDKMLAESEDGHLGEDEEDMLDMAFGLTHTSRLGCQITVGEVMEGSVITLPKATRNFYVDGHKPKPH
jgi:ferredoxin